MSKRKLTRRQAWRIEKIQQERIARAKKRSTQAEIDLGKLGQEQNGLVIAHFGTQVEVETKLGQHTIRKRCHFRSNLGSLVTGDRVIWCDGDPTGVIVAVQERESELCRPDPYGDLKAVAANIDRILIVVAPLPKPHTQLVDRYLVAAETVGIKPALVINKMDLIDDAEQHEVIKGFIELYTSLDYEVITASTKKGHGLDDLSYFLTGHTSIFVGQSGVGKSSLINSLIPNLALQVGDLSSANQKGTHTTTTAQLFHFPQEGHLIDSPGIREFGLWHMSEEQIIEGFIEFRPYIGHCKFRDCQHRKEPGCAIQQAHKDDHISDYRMQSYEALRDQLDQ